MCRRQEKYKKAPSPRDIEEERAQFGSERGRTYEVRDAWRVEDNKEKG